MKPQFAAVLLLFSIFICVVSSIPTKPSKPTKLAAKTPAPRPKRTTRKPASKPAAAPPLRKHKPEILEPTEVRTSKKHDHIWPHPQHLNMSNSYFIISPSDFSIHTESTCDLITSAISRYLTRMFTQDCSRLDGQFKNHFWHKTPANFTGDSDYLGSLRNLTLKFNGVCEKLPHMAMNELYYLTVDEKGVLAEISSESAWGILRGLETFSQLVENIGPNQYRIQVVKILDSPRYSHRGLMIDSSRHYLPLHTILQTLDAMEMNKFNVLHWHLVDDQSFPFVSQTFPELAQKGAFDPETHIYTKKDVDDVIEYARMRGIRVLAEFDTPGHTHAWGKGIPNLLTQCYDAQKKAIPGRFGPMDVTLFSTYTFIEKLFTEIVARFPDAYQHLGGDEVDFTCWASNPKIGEFMKANGLGNDYRKLESFYIQKLVKIIEDLQKSYIVWQEVFDDGVILANDTVVHVWKPVGWQAEMKKVTAANFRVLLSAPWYLNRIKYGTDWPDFYQIEPTNFAPSTAQQKSLIMGGEACMWSEWVDASNLISRTWPRACAVAERLWSPQGVNSVAKAKARFHAQHCRMQSLGLRVQPNDGPGYFCKCDYAM